MGLFDSAASVIGGLINNGRALPTVDIQPLLNTINANKNTNETLINQLPANLAPLMAAYQKALADAGVSLKSDTSAIGQKMLDQTKALYDPNSAAVQATLAALKQQDYSTLPGNIDALKANLAASGGLSRGGAARAITQATLAPAAAYSGQAATVEGQQLQAGQAAQQAAINKIAAMDDNVVQQLFGMSKEEATNILNTGRSDLKDQLAQLINNNNAATASTLGAEGVAANNAYQNAVTRNNQQAAITNGLVNLGVEGAATMFGGPAAGAAAGAASPDTVSQYQNILNSGTSFPGALTL